MRVHLDAFCREAEGVRELQEEATVGRRRVKGKQDPILAYVQMLEKGLERLREEVTRG